MPNFFRFLFIVVMLFFDFDSKAREKDKPTICILGGTPSSSRILEEIPIELRTKYNFISLNRPGYGNTHNFRWEKEDLFKLAKGAGLEKKDFAVIGISGGGPLAILIAHEFNIKHCGVISGMVPAKEYFAYADSTFTKPLMSSVLVGFNEFKINIESFPNVEEILIQADSPLSTAIRACYDDLTFILSDNNFNKKIFHKTSINWWHGEYDKNVSAESAQLFLSNFKNHEFKKIPNASHGIDARDYIKTLLIQWEHDLKE